ncbi:SAM-dependent DNA methyltransferase [Nostoc sphaeroides CCNUC1]|uniref:SAM-dependent DNA methyltransferase n=1 Tax=Nostoc sphaeroides CCNUC1 TaxID=2653204 RepID=A0A5P8VVK3_9NOSO|nr:SAM-dependent DNA methyltransferase [Nostoc sphaeroides CCNUC1]
MISHSVSHPYIYPKLFFEKSNNGAFVAGIPKVEVEAKSSLSAAHGFDATRIFVERN